MPSYPRRAFIFTIAILLLLPITTIAAKDEKPRVFINTASQIGFYLGSNYGLAKFSEVARESGFTIDHGVHPDLVTGSPLEGIDVYILFEPNFPFTSEDKVALRQWVRAGGVLIAGDWFNPTGMSSFVEEFGVEFIELAFQNVIHKLYVPTNSPFAGPKSISFGETFRIRYLKIIDATRSEPILKYDSGDVAVTRTISFAGKGEIIVISNLDLILDPSGAIGGIDRADNRKIVQNMFTHIKAILGGASSGDGFDLNLYKLKTKGGGTFVPGEEIKFVAKIRNIGTQLSEATHIYFYIERVGAAPSAVIEVDSASVPAIKAKKKIKIVKKTFLPDDLDPGTYEVTAVIDPNELTSDANTGNNSATAKKTIIVQ